VFAPAAEANHDRAAPYSGEWKIQAEGAAAGRLLFRAVDKATGQAALNAIEEGDYDFTCQIRPLYWIGTFSTPTDNGPIAGCGRKEDYARSYSSYGWYRSDVAQPGAIGELNPHVTVPGGDGFAFTTVPGSSSPIHNDLTFIRHFKGDGAREIYAVDFRVRQDGEPSNGGPRTEVDGDGTMFFREEPRKGEVISGDADATLVHGVRNGRHEVKIRFDGSGPYELANRGSEIELLGKVVKSTDEGDCPKGTKVRMKLLDHRIRSQDRMTLRGKGDCQINEVHEPGRDNKVKVEVYPSYFEDMPR
jgi:hypothetical protein